MTKAPELYDINMKISDLSSILEQMEDEDLDSHIVRSKNYTTIISLFHDSALLDDKTTERLLSMCHRDLTRDLQYSSSAVMTIALILKKIKEGQCNYPTAKLVESALIVVKITKKLLMKPLLRKLSFEALIAYPDDTLIALVDSHSKDIIDLIDYQPLVNYQTEITSWISCFIEKLLQVLPRDKKLSFVRKSLDVWFGTFLPGVMVAFATNNGTATQNAIAALELLTTSLKEIDYTDNLKWQVVLSHICDPKSYPLILKNSVTKGSDNWHILWKVFIILLKDQITKIYKTNVTPINALLPVLEQAFKMDPSYRCKAFECWNVLIDNFSIELNELLIGKRIKLLMVPLRLNNAKTEDTILAKLNTWWHLIRRFRGKMDKFTDTVLMPFLHFCFGKPVENTTGDTNIINPGLMSNKLALKSLEALVEIVGHVDCDGCCTLPSVGGSLISTKLLVEHWASWVHALKAAMKAGVENYHDPVIKRIKCLWNGFVMVIAELPDNQIRADLFMELLKYVEALLETSNSNNNVADLVFEIFISSLLKESPKIRPLLKHKQATILCMIQNPVMNDYFSRIKDPEEKVAKLKPLAALIMDSSITDTDKILRMWIVSQPSMSNARLYLWAAIVDAIFESKRDLKSLTQSILLLAIMPLKMRNISDEINTKAIWYRWFTFYNHIHVHSMINSAKLDEEIRFILTGKNEPAICLRLSASMALFKQKLVSDKNTELQTEAQGLLDALSSLQGSVMDEFFPILTDTLVLFLNNRQTTSNVDLAKVAVMLLQGILKCLNISLKKNSDTQKPIYIDNLQNSSRKFLDKLSKNETFASLKTAIAHTYKIKAELDHTVTNRFNVSKAIRSSDTDGITDVENVKFSEQKEVSDKTNFTTPLPKSAKKAKSNKKEPNIVNTIDVNGEEFVVVKSHWKFNPKKLTENQKDKFTRKREDIPALYQDLSQSQEEFKLTTWKTDSQDASTSTSKSESNSKTKDDVAVILQKMPSTEVVSNIIENIFSDTINKNKEKTAEKNDNDNNNKLEKTPTVKSPRTPRLALKDKVLRNVRNLIEKSGLQSDSKLTDPVKEGATVEKGNLNEKSDLQGDVTVAAVNENNLKAPIPKATLNVVNSVSPKHSTERPTRSIRKPKKFDDTEIFALKKNRRRSQGSIHSDSQPDDVTPHQVSSVAGSNKQPENVNIDAEQTKDSMTNEHPKSSDVDNTGEPCSIKKPNNFEDTEKFALKLKRRRSQGSIHSDSQPDDVTPDQRKETTTNLITVPIVAGSIKQRENVNKDEEHTKDSMTNEHPKSSKPDVDNTEKRSPHIETSEETEPTEQANKTDRIETVNDKMEIEECNSPKKSINANIDNSSQVIEEISTPKLEKTMKKEDIPSIIKIKKSRIEKQSSDLQSTPGLKKTMKNDDNLSSIKTKRSRIEKQLLIDMVEGHPVLQQSQSEKRSSRKNLTNEINYSVTKRRKSVIEKLNKIKPGLVNAGIADIQTKEKTKPGSKSSSPISDKQKAVTEQQTEQSSQSVTIVDSQKHSFESQDAMSEDVIESSQDSTLTTISVKSATKKKVPMVRLDKENALFTCNSTETQKLIDDFNNEVIPLSDILNETGNQESREDIELPKNKTMPEENAEADLTEDMDTEPMDSSGEVIIINDDIATPIVLNTEETVVGKETQEIAEADTLPMDINSQSIPPTSDETSNNTANIATLEKKLATDNDTIIIPTQDDITPTLSGPAEVVTDIIVESSNSGSPLKDEIQRKKEFLNDTIEISPIKTVSPVRKKSPSPETSRDYVVIKLTSPVQSNGEPYNEKCDSPAVFTEDKVSPDKRDQSPPRKEVAPANSSPSSSLSLKKNRPQMRFNGRAAQMFEKLQILNTERSENEEDRNNSPVSTPARRNLKKFYTSAGDHENEANKNEIEDIANFLKFTKPLPSAESSPSNPILKRKLADVTDECTLSPASKRRKRVSFHDPPVSTTVAVQKYIEPCGVRSPSNSAIKRQERQLRALTNAKSSKRLDNVFRLETVLTKAVESFTDDTEMSLDDTPAAEVVTTSELNDTDPICPELLVCKDPIGNIAADLSSPSTKALLIKELEGKVETVADLAKMTELEVNRLCIKAPKVKVAKKVLSKYASEKAKSQDILETPVTPVADPTPITPSPIMVAEIERVHMECQTDEVLTKNSEMQTTEVTKTLVHTQTDAVHSTHCGTQTKESGSSSTKDVVSTCLKERPDFVDQLIEQLQHSEKLPFDACLSLLSKKMTLGNYPQALNQVLSLTSKYTPEESMEMDFNILKDHLSKRYDANSLVLFCSKLLMDIHKPS